MSENELKRLLEPYIPESIVGHRVGIKDGQILVQELLTGFIYELGRFSVIRQICPSEYLCEFSLF